MIITMEGSELYSKDLRVLAKRAETGDGMAMEGEKTVLRVQMW